MRVCVFCGSSDGVVPAHRRTAQALGQVLVARGHGVVYGGAGVGLMGAVADAALGAGGEVHGVIPLDMVDRELAHPSLSALDVVDGMHARKARMAELADAFVALPGGLGTLEELFEVWTWRQLGLHAAPLALLDVGGYWAPLRRLVDQAVDAGFVSEESRSWLLVDDDAEALVRRLEEAVGARPVPLRRCPGASASGSDLPPRAPTALRSPGRPAPAEPSTADEEQHR